MDRDHGKGSPDARMIGGAALVVAALGTMAYAFFGMIQPRHVGSRGFVAEFILVGAALVLVLGINLVVMSVQSKRP